MKLMKATIEFVLVFTACVVVVFATLLLSGVAATYLGVL